MWKIRQEANKPELLELYIYGEVEGDSMDYCGNVVESETSANHFRSELAARPEVKNIDIYINSVGGSVFEGTAIYNQLRRSPAYKTVYVDGFACSIASVIAMAGDKIIMPRNTMMMIHNAWSAAVGNAKELRKAADDLDIINTAGREAYIQHAGSKLTPELLTQMMDDETWLTADMCLSYGLCDEVLGSDADLTAAKAQLDAAQDKTRTYHGDIAAAARIAAALRGNVPAAEPVPITKAEPAKPEKAPEPAPAAEDKNKLIKIMAAMFAAK